MTIGELKKEVKWGVFDWIPGEMHVVPCSMNGIMQEGHILDISCFCEPEIFEGSIISHRNMEENN
jgi:hypothetical protein